MILDTWQKEVLATKGHICLRSGRQVGKSTIISIKAGKYALSTPDKTIMVIAATERQARLLFEKILSYIILKAKNMICIKKKKPTKTRIQLKNGSNIYCLPTGDSGYGIRGYTINLLIADEAAFIQEAVWSAVTPMLATTGGNIILLSTPVGREGYFARCFKDPAYTKFHISSIDCSRIPEDFLAHEKETMSKREWQQEYLGNFVDDLMQFFPDALIVKSQILSRSGVVKDNCFLGVDIARMGGDETTFEIIDRTNRDKLRHVENITKTDIRITDTAREINRLNKQYDFRKIYIDDGGLGVGVFDILIENPETKRKVIGINNAQRSIEYDPDKPRKKRLLKEDLYNNLKNLMEQNKLQLLDDPEVFQSLKSIQFEYNDAGTMRIFGARKGRYAHIAEGLIRACWCNKDNSLNLFCYY